VTSFLTPFTFANGVRVGNRLAVAPMTTSQSHADGTVSEAEIAWLERLARDGYGLVITCAAAISKCSIAFHRQMSLGDDRFLPGLRALAAALSPHRALAVVQLCHGGSRAIPALTGRPAHAPSRYELPAVPGFVPPSPFEEAEIEQIVRDHADAAARAHEAGFAGVELHGANGYLHTQFLSTMTNLRTDAWGGSLENRARFSREVVRAIRRRVPAAFVVGFRMTFEGMGFDTGLDLDENVRVMNWLAEDGIDYGHVSSMDVRAESARYPGESLLERVRAGVDRALPLVGAGGVRSAEEVRFALARGADLVAVARAAIGNADLPAKLGRGETLRATPYALDELRALQISDDFVRYLRDTWPISTLNVVAREAGEASAAQGA
jgi:2,4-dienoyl-CoA reductase-like NADH-dependent reductase (Old Yellow Enzyme family)